MSNFSAPPTLKEEAHKRRAKQVVLRPLLGPSPGLHPAAATKPNEELRHPRHLQLVELGFVPSPASFRRAYTSYVVQPAGTGRREVRVACPCALSVDSSNPTPGVASPRPPAATVATG